MDPIRDAPRLIALGMTLRLDQILDPASYVMTPYAWPPLVVGVLTAALGFLVLIRERGTLVSVAFWLMTMAGTVWLGSNVGIFAARDPSVAFWWAQVENIAVAFIPCVVYFFTLAIAQRLRPYRAVVIGSLVLSTAFAVAVLKTDWFVNGVYHYRWGYYARYGHLSDVFLLYFAGLMVESFRLLWVERRRCHSPTQQRRLRALFHGFCIAYLASADFLPAYGIPVYPFGYVPVFVFLMVGARAIWRYRLVDITPAFAARQIMRTMADALLVVDCEGVIRVANEAACRLFERGQRALVGQPIAVIAPAFFKTSGAGAGIPGTTVERYETTYPTQRRGPLALDVLVSALPDHTGTPVGTVWIARDVTGRKRAEQMVQAAKLYAEHIVETIREPLVVLDAHRRVKAANRAFCDTFRMAFEEVRNRRIDEIGRGRWNVSKLLGMLELLPPDAPFEGVELDYEFPGLGSRTLLVNARRLHRHGDPAEAILLAMEDVTERKRMEEHLKAAMAELEASRLPHADAAPLAPPGSRQTRHAA